MGPTRRGAGGRTYVGKDGDGGARVFVKEGTGATFALVRNEIVRRLPLRHPRIPAIRFAHVDEGHARVAFTFVEGGPLGASRFESWEAAAGALADLASTLAYLHALGIVHGDVKPDNVVVDVGGAAHLVDFGAARLGAGMADELAGTPAFLSPEASRGESGPASDVFAFGTLAEALVREFEDGGLHVPSEILRIFATCRTEDPSTRPSADDVHRALRGRSAPIAGALLATGPSGRIASSALRMALLARLAPPSPDARRAQNTATTLVGPPGSGKTHTLRAVDEDLTRARVHVEPSGPLPVAALAWGFDRDDVVVVVDGIDEVDDALADRMGDLARQVRDHGRAHVVLAGRDRRLVGLAAAFADDVVHLEASGLSRNEATAWLRTVDARAILDAPDLAPLDAGEDGASRPDARLLPGELLRRVEALDAGGRGPASPSGLPSAADEALRLLRAGAFADVIALAAKVHASAASRLDRAHVDVTSALALANMGRVDDAGKLLEDVRRSLAPQDPARLRFRAANASAIVAYRAGDVGGAKHRYEEALRIAEEANLDEQVVLAASNLGGVAHQTGDWGDALAAYTSGLERARRRGATTSARILRFNEARLAMDIGAFARARELAAELEPELRAAGDAPVLLGGLVAMQAEDAWLRGDAREARAKSASAREILTAASAPREADECLASDLEAEGWSGDVAVVGTDAWEESARGLVARARTNGWSDVEVRGLAALGASERARGRAADAVKTLERAIAIAEKTGRRTLVASVATRLDAAYRASSAIALAAKARTRAREAWERTLANLPLHLHDAFRTHPHRRGTFESATLPGPEDPASLSVAKVRQLLAINRRLAAATDSRDVLEATMDAAVDLTSAERGFLLLRGEDAKRKELVVAIARNMDREVVKKASAKFSRGIAERVVASGEVIRTHDAGLDPTLERNRSVHAMKLRSVLSVPIREGGTVVGAIYLDNRFRPRAFDEEAIEIVTALADQAGIALSRARLLAELARRTEELDAERARTESDLSEAQRALASLRETPHVPRGPDEFGAIVGRSPGIRRVLDVVRRVRDIDVPVLVHGESGTGKELVARAIHDTGTRARAPFLAINCGSMPESLLEAELFGYEKGAFTGASQSKAGLLVDAGEGTMFFDEVGEMSLAMQVKLLRALQEREVRPLGSSETRRIEARMIFATHRDLGEEVRLGRFREDLYFRIAVVLVNVPPLRDRREDLTDIAAAILERACAPEPPKRLHADALRVLLRMDWPGNVRQLENVLRRAVVFSDGDRIQLADLGVEMETPRRRGNVPGEAARIQASLRANDWNVVVTAKELGIPRASLYRKLARYGLARPDEDGRSGSARRSPDREA
ncbi:MAG: sigma 54-interacting transcriptional regulator [Polyangiaceae bacterium]